MVVCQIFVRTHNFEWGTNKGGKSSAKPHLSGAIPHTHNVRSRAAQFGQTNGQVSPHTHTTITITPTLTIQHPNHTTHTKYFVKSTTTIRATTIILTKRTTRTTSTITTMQWWPHKVSSKILFSRIKSYKSDKDNNNIINFNTRNNRRTSK